MRIPLSRPLVTPKMINAAVKVLKSGLYIKGPIVKKFEEEFSNYCGTKFGTATCNGTASIYIALRALGVGRGDEVVVPSHSFIASASPILMCGAKPVFVDVDETYTIDIKDLKSKLTTNTKAVIAVHLYGQMCEMDELLALKEKKGFYLVEDAAQAHGAKYHGKKAGSIGDIACFSFFPAKNMTVCGDGGMVITSDPELYKKTQTLRDHGRNYSKKEGKYISEVLTLNFRMNEIMAAIGIEQLKKLDDWNEKRIKIASSYDKYLTEKITKPTQRNNSKHVFHQYVIRVNERDKLREHLDKNDIQTGIHYPIPIHKQPIFSNFKCVLPNTEKFCRQILSLPNYPSMKIKDSKIVIDKINEFCLSNK